MSESDGERDSVGELHSIHSDDDEHIRDVDGVGTNNTGGELDYEPSESGDNVDESIGRDQDDDEVREGGVSQLDTITNDDDEEEDEGVIEDGEIDDLEDGELKDDDDGDDDAQQARLSSSSYRQSYQSPPASTTSSSFTHQPIRAPSSATPTSTATGTGPGFGLASSVRPEDVGICKFYLRGQCTWGNTCKFMHPQNQDRSSHWKSGDVTPSSIRNSSSTEATINDNVVVNTRRVPISMISTSYAVPPPKLSTSVIQSPSSQQRSRPVVQSFQQSSTSGASHISSSSLSMQSTKESDESAWERGLKQARELMKKANEKREREPDFEKKRLVLAPSDDSDIRKSSSVYDDSDGENESASQQTIDKRRKPTNDYYHQTEAKQRNTNDNAAIFNERTRRRSSEDRRTNERSSSGGGHINVNESISRDYHSGDSSASRSATRNASSSRHDYYRENASFYDRSGGERRPAFDPGPQVLYPSRDRERQRAREREQRVGSTTNDRNNRSSFDDRSSNSGSRYHHHQIHDRERTSSLRNTVDDAFSRGTTGGGDYYHRRNIHRRSPDRPLPYDRPAYDDSRSNEIRDPWERDRRSTAAVGGSLGTTADQGGGHRGSSSSSTFSSKRSHSNSRSKSIETYSSSHSSASPETRARKRKRRDDQEKSRSTIDNVLSSATATVVDDTPVPYRIPRLSARKSANIDRTKSASTKRSHSPLASPTRSSPDRKTSSTIRSGAEIDDDVRAPIKITIRPKARISTNAIGSPPIVADTISSSSSSPSSKQPSPERSQPTISTKARNTNSDEAAQLLLLHEQISMTTSNVKKKKFDKDSNIDDNNDDGRNATNRDSRREELLRQLKSVEDAIAKKRSKTTAAV